MLTAFTQHPHRHLVKLLCTYEHKNKYYLLFPYAKSNLRKYWEDNPMPEFSEATFAWSLQQCKCLASGLHMIHEHRTTRERATLQRVRSGHENLPGIEEDDRLYGRHGDIKPEVGSFSLFSIIDSSPKVLRRAPTTYFFARIYHVTRLDTHSNSSLFLGLVPHSLMFTLWLLLVLILTWKTILLLVCVVFTPQCVPFRPLLDFGQYIALTCCRTFYGVLKNRPMVTRPLPNRAFC